jgi:hypothetical protein
MTLATGDNPFRLSNTGPHLIVVPSDQQYLTNGLDG